MTSERSSWQTKAAKKVAQTWSKIPADWILSEEDLNRSTKEKKLTGSFIESFLEDEEIKIIQNDAAALIRVSNQGNTHVVQLQMRINNCLHEIFFDQAFLRADFLDDYFEKHGRPIGPLHGLPVSLKDQFHVKGLDTTMGYIGWIDTYEGNGDSKKVHQVESQIVNELLMLGAVIYCKTSLPQTLMFGETINNLIGQTLNPINQSLSCGGSSGGEGALQALRGSSIGLGTDIGGSVRIPAAFCGLYSIKPTHNRLSYRDVANTNPGQVNYCSSVGVIATSLDSLRLLMTSILSTEPWLRDPDVVPIPWRSEQESQILARAAPDGSAKKNSALKLGLFWTDGYVTPHPPITRGLQLLATAVQKASHKVVDWNPSMHREAASIHLDFLLSDGGYDVNKQLKLSGEPLIPPLREVFNLKPPLSAIQTQELATKGRDCCAAYSDYWNSQNGDGQAVDAVIMPAAPHAAVLPGHYYYTGYTETINLLDYSAVVIPVTKADKRIDTVPQDYKPLSDLDRKNWGAYDAEKYDGAPVGLQIVARKNEEEKVWAIAKIIDTVLRASSGV